MINSIGTRIKSRLIGLAIGKKNLFDSSDNHLPILQLRHAVICSLCGGLANQMLAYKLGRFIAKSQSRTLILDASWYADEPATTNRNLQLLNYDIVYDAISYDKYLISRILNSHDTTLLAADEFVHFEKPEVQKLARLRVQNAGAIISCDLWGSLALRNEASEFARNHGVLEELSLDVDKHFCEANRAFLVAIQKSPNPVAVHVRRGDFATHDGNLLLTADYFNNAIAALKADLKSPSFFVFSDDIEWCRGHLFGADITFVAINDERSGYKDLALAAACHHFILSHRSTYSTQILELARKLDSQRIIQSTNQDFVRQSSQTGL